MDIVYVEKKESVQNLKSIKVIVGKKNMKRQAIQNSTPYAVKLGTFMHRPVYKILPWRSNKV